MSHSADDRPEGSGDLPSGSASTSSDEWRNEPAPGMAADPAPYGTDWQPYGGQANGQPYGGQAYGQPYGAVQPYGQLAPVARKEPGLMLLVSFFIPGLGTILNGETRKGVGILIGYFISYLLIFVLIGIPMVIGFWIWGMIDAYNGAKNFNARHGLP